MPDKLENGTLTMKTKQKFSVHTSRDKMFCVQTTTIRAPLSMRTVIIEEDSGNEITWQS